MATKRKSNVKVKTKKRPLGTVRRPARDLDVSQLQITGERKAVADVRRSITDGTLETTIDGASTLTLVVSDHSRGFIQSTLAQSGAQLTFDNVPYVSVKVSHNADQVTLTFEERAVNLLRQYDTPRKSNRANTTRAQFIQGLCKEVKEAVIPFKCPELNKRQAIASASKT